MSRCLKNYHNVFWNQEQNVKQLRSTSTECCRIRECKEKAMAPHSSTLAWKIPWMEEPGRVQSMGSLRVRHDWVTSLSLFIFCIGGGNDNLLQCSCLENPRDGGAWWAAIYRVSQSQTWLKWLSSNRECKMLLKNDTEEKDAILFSDNI